MRDTILRNHATPSVKKLWMVLRMTLAILKRFLMIVFWSIGILLFVLSVLFLKELFGQISDISFSYFNWMAWMGMIGIAVSFLYLIFFLLFLSYSFICKYRLGSSSLDDYSYYATYVFFLVPVFLAASDVMIRMAGTAVKFGLDKRPLIVLSSDISYFFIIYLISMVVFSLVRLFRSFDLKFMLLSAIPVLCLSALFICFYISIISIKS